MARMIKEMVVQDCPIRNVLARVCDKWSLLVIYTLKIIRMVLSGLMPCVS